MSKFLSAVASAGRLGAVALAAWAALPMSAHADTLVTATIAPQYLDDPGTYPASVGIGTFSLTTPGTSAGTIDTLVGATVSGIFGDAFGNGTAPGTYSVGGVNVFQCNDGDACWNGDFFDANGNFVGYAWSYTFTAQQLASLDGDTNYNEALNIAFNILQSDVGSVDTGVTSLTLDFQVPEPASIALIGAGLLGLGIALRSKRA